jgi:hypothetical protein
MGNLAGNNKSYAVFSVSLVLNFRIYKLLKVLINNEQTKLARHQKDIYFPLMPSLKGISKAIWKEFFTYFRRIPYLT